MSDEIWGQGFGRKSRKPGTQSPEERLAKKAAYFRATMADRRARGECARCEEPVAEGVSARLCATHFARDQKQRRDRYEKRKELEARRPKP